MKSEHAQQQEEGFRDRPRRLLTSGLLLGLNGLRKFASPFFLLLCVLASFIPSIASAHEAYVLPTAYFWQQLNGPDSFGALNALANPDNIRITFYVVAGTFVVYLLNFLLRRTKLGHKLHKAPERLAFLGPIFVRAAIAAAFFYSALSWSFLGPELSLYGMPVPWLLRGVLFAASGMIALGLFTEVAGVAALIVYCIGFWRYGLYIVTYLNYLGEIIVLALFGMRKWSLDKLIFGPLARFKKLREYETTIVRVCYGIALIYAAITVKFLHPAMTARVVTDWHLTQFHWLFPSDPLLIVLGGGLAECAIGLFILIGFEMRLTVLISLFYITLSLFYFRELVWPHLMLYGISLSLLVKPETFTLDHVFFARKDRDSRSVS